MPPILQVDSVTKKYGSFTAVNGLSLSVEEGEVFGLLGPNGAGKTTLISVLTGVIPPTSGTARVAGHDIVKEPGKVKRLIGLVPQDLALYPTMTARKNLAFFGRIYGLSGAELKQRVADVLSVVALSDRADQAVQTFSGGMKRRVNIAAGLVHQPRLLFLDEPTVGVDPQSRNHIFESVMQLNRERGMSIIYTSHYMEEVQLLCSRVAIVDRGQIVALDSVKNLIDSLGGGVINVGLSQVDAQLLSDLAALPAVKEVGLAPIAVAETEVEQAAEAAGQPQDRAPGPQTVKIVAEHSQQALTNVVNFLNQRDLAISALEILEPNLENVFLHLTGKKLRE